MVEKLRQTTPFDFCSSIAVTTPALPVVALAQGRGLPMRDRSAEDTAFCTVSSSERPSAVFFFATVLVEIDRSTSEPKRSMLPPKQPLIGSVAARTMSKLLLPNGPPFLRSFDFAMSLNGRPVQC